MQKITSASQLKSAIRQLESDRETQAGQLRNQFIQTAESLHPKNILISVLKDFLSSPLVLMIGIETIKSYGFRLIDRIFKNKTTP